MLHDSETWITEKQTFEVNTFWSQRFFEVRQTFEVNARMMEINHYSLDWRNFMISQKKEKTGLILLIHHILTNLIVERISEGKFWDKTNTGILLNM